MLFNEIQVQIENLVIFADVGQLCDVYVIVFLEACYRMTGVVNSFTARDATRSGDYAIESCLSCLSVCPSVTSRRYSEYHRVTDGRTDRPPYSVETAKRIIKCYTGG